MIKKRPKEQVLADIRKRFEQGHVEATAERLKRIAARELDPEILRQMASIACDALTAPTVKRPRKRPPAKKLVITKDGAADLDATPPMTAREQLRYAREQAHDHAIFEQVSELESKFTTTGAIREVVRLSKDKSMTESVVKNAYYRVKQRHSLKV